MDDYITLQNKLHKFIWINYKKEKFGCNKL